MKSSKTKGLVGLALCALAVVCVIVPGIGFIGAVTAKAVVLADGPHPVTLPAHKTYGIYFDDTDNSGYTEQCMVTDDGRPVKLSDAGWSISSSATETLDLEFDTGSGHLVIACTTSAERMVTRPVPNFMSMVIGLGLGFLLGVAGFVVLAVWLLDGFAGRREKRRREDDGFPSA